VNDHLEMDVGGAAPGQFRQGIRASHPADGGGRRAYELDRLGMEDIAQSQPDHGFPQFIAVIDNWRTVAMDTHTKYGTCAIATHL